MIGRRLVPPTSSKGSKDKSKQVKASENRNQIGKEVEIKEEAWSPMGSPTPSWSELSLYWSEGSVSSRSQSPPPLLSSLLTFGGQYPPPPRFVSELFLSAEVLQSRPSPPPCPPPPTSTPRLAYPHLSSCQGLLHRYGSCSNKSWCRSLNLFLTFVIAVMSKMIDYPIFIFSPGQTRIVLLLLRGTSDGRARGTACANSARRF